MPKTHVAMAQVNPTVGDLDGNRHIILEYLRRAADANVDLVAFPEMVMTGYPPLDLLPPAKRVRQTAIVSQSRKNSFDSTNSTCMT